MKKRIISFLLAFTLLLTACANSNNDNKKNESNTETSTEESKNDKTNAKKLNIVASFFPVYDLTKKIVGDKANVLNLTQSGDAHGFEPNIKDMATIEKSDLLVINGAGMEPWVNNIKTNFPNLNTLELAKSVEILKMDDVKEYNIINGKDDHEHHDHDHSEEHDHGEEIDPHIWISPKLAEKMLLTIKDKIIELDTKNKDYYEANYNKYKEELIKLSKEYDEALSKHKGKSIVVPHVAFNYIFTPYKIKQIGISGINSTEGPTATRLAEIVKLLKDNDIKTVFYEYGGSDKTAQAIANEVGGNVKPISSLEVISQADIDKGDDYISLMRMNLKNISDAFEGK